MNMYVICIRKSVIFKDEKWSKKSGKMRGGSPYTFLGGEFEQSDSNQYVKLGVERWMGKTNMSFWCGTRYYWCGTRYYFFDGVWGEALGKVWNSLDWERSKSQPTWAFSECPKKLVHFVRKTWENQHAHQCDNWKFTSAPLKIYEVTLPSRS